MALENDAGDFRRDLNAVDAAYLIIAFIQGLAVRWSLDRCGFDLAKEGGRLPEIQFQALR